jgi:hypothetical protein
MVLRDATPLTDPHLFIPGTDYLMATIDVIFKILMSLCPSTSWSFPR